MAYVDFEIDERALAVGLLMADVASELQRMATERGTTVSEIADKLGIEDTRASKMMSGFQNLTFKDFAELCWAMGVEPNLTINLRENPVAGR